MEALKKWYSWIESELRKSYIEYEHQQKWKEDIASIKAIPRQNVSRSALVSSYLQNTFGLFLLPSTKCFFLFLPQIGIYWGSMNTYCTFN